MNVDDGYMKKIRWARRGRKQYKLCVGDTPLDTMDLLYQTVFILRGLKLINRIKMMTKTKDKGPFRTFNS